MTTRQRARNLRKQSTIPERKLWQVLRNRKLTGLKFCRQHPIGKYIVDYFCTEADLIVEVDGDSHDERTYKYDMQRQKYLEEERGYKVFRVTNDDILEDIESVALGIAKAAGVDISNLM